MLVWYTWGPRILKSSFYLDPHAGDHIQVGLKSASENSMITIEQQLYLEWPESAIQAETV